MAFHSVNQCLLVGLLIVALSIGAQAARKSGRGRPRPSGSGNFGCAADSAVNNNITALWTHMKLLSQPIEVHVHEDRMKCDDYFGCAFSDHSGHDHSDHSHHAHHGHSHDGDKKGKGQKHSHKHGSHKHGSHKHGSHKHGDHKHGSHGHGHDHGHHGGMEAGFMDNHIHIHLSVNNKEDCPFVSYAPKDEYVYARCDMVPEKRSGIKGKILMRQKPHGNLTTKIQLSGFKGPSEGIKDGKHDYFFDLHEKADFTNGCVSFGDHNHVHHSDGKFDHDHDHKHEHDHDHNHDHHDGHNHTLHDHHAHESDWGNVIINKKGFSNMEVTCTHHELYGPESMLGRGLVLHDKNDKIVACCAITYANIDDDSWEKL